jgi:hypothetical protein
LLFVPIRRHKANTRPYRFKGLCAYGLTKKAQNQALRQVGFELEGAVFPSERKEASMLYGARLTFIFAGGQRSSSFPRIATPLDAAGWTAEKQMGTRPPSQPRKKSCHLVESRP